MRHDSPSPIPQSDGKPCRWRVTIRASLVAIAFLAIVLAMITPLVRGRKRERFVHGSMHASSGTTMQSQSCAKCHASPHAPPAVAMAPQSPSVATPDRPAANDPHPGLMFAGKDNTDCRQCHATSAPNTRVKTRELQ
jgi:hypothetical protein